MSIGTRIKEARLKKGITQTDLAKFIGVSKGAIGNYESDYSSPKDEILYKIMAALDVDANYIFQDGIKKPATVTDDELIMQFKKLPENTKRRALEFAKFVLLQENQDNL